MLPIPIGNNTNPQATDVTEDIDHKKLTRLFDRLNAKLPAGAASFVTWLISPSGALLRLPLALLLIAGGIFSFLPLLGIWMLPLGLMLIAIDVPPVRRWVVRTWPKVEARWRHWRMRRARQQQSKP